MQHNDNADVGKCLCLGPASHCVAECRQGELEGGETVTGSEKI